MKLSAKNKKQAGFILTSEAVLLSTVLVIGMVTGLTTVRDSMNAELEDVAEAFGSLDQSYTIDGIQNDHLTAASAGSQFTDATDKVAGDKGGFTFIAADDFEGAAPRK